MGVIRLVAGRAETVAAQDIGQRRLWFTATAIAVHPLDCRARYRAVGTEHTAVAMLRPQRPAAADAVIKNWQASVGIVSSFVVPHSEQVTMDSAITTILSVKAKACSQYRTLRSRSAASVQCDKGAIVEYLFRVKSPAEGKAPWDYCELVDSLPSDSIWRPLGEGGCPLVHRRI